MHDTIKKYMTIVSGAIAEKRDLTDEEVAECRGLQEQIDADNAKDQVDAEVRAQLATLNERILAERVVPADAEGETRLAGRGHYVNLRSAAQLGLKAYDGGFKSANEFFRAVLSSRHDPRLDDLVQRSVLEGQPSAGGFAIPDTYAAGSWSGTIEASVAMGLCRTYLAGNGQLRVPSFDDTSHASNLFGGMSASWTAEEGTIDESTPKFREITLTPNALKCLTIISNEALANGVDLEQVVNDALTQTLSWTIDEAILRGDGAGKPLGILNANCTVEQAAEGGQAVDTIVAENVFRMWSRLMPGSHSRAVWFAHPSTLPQLYALNISIGTGGSAVYQPAGGMSASPFSTLMGRPVYITEKASAVGDAGDLILADMSFYALALRKTITVDRSEHAYFATDRTALRAVAYLDGQPMLASSLTPYKGSDALSPFVTLAAR